jgi:hypothetical protein
MTILLADLVARLAALVPPDGGVPTTAQQQQAITDAVRDVGRRASVVAQTTLAVVAGTAGYILPADFVTLIRLSAIGVPFSGVAVTPAGLVPMSGADRELITVSGGVLTITPTPQWSSERALWYAAGHALVDGGYPTLTEERAAIALLAARAACLDLLASQPGAAGIKLTAGGDSVDTTRRGPALREQAQMLRAQYEAAIGRLHSGAGGLA